MLDDLDNKLLEILQLKGRTKRNELAEYIKLSVPAVSERLKKLEDHGIIEGYFAKVNRQSYGLDILAFIYVIMESSQHYKDLIKKCLLEIPKHWKSY
jgi:Lrp/AsnC family leucine-responsive transcriptional regulator